MSQENNMRIAAELPGSALKWIHIAEVEFHRRGFNLDSYRVQVVDQPWTVVVILAALNPMPPAAMTPAPVTPPYPPVPQTQTPGARGSSSSLPGYEVEISKQEMKILRSNFVR